MKRIRKYITALLLSILVPVLVQAQNAAPQQLIELINAAINNYPKLKEANEYVTLAQARREQSFGAYMPVIGGNATYRYAQPTPEINIPIPGVQPISFIPANNYDFNISLTQPVWDFGKTQASVKKTLVDIQTAKDNEEQSKLTLAYQVAQLYYGIVFLNKSAQVQQEQINLLGENEKFIENKVKNGDALQFDLLSTQVKKNNSQNRLIDLETMIAKQYELLNMFTAKTGIGYITDTVVVAPFVTEMVNTENNYDVKSIENRLSSNEWDVKIAKRGWLPQLFVNAQVGYKNGYVPDIDKLQFNYFAGAGLSIPIFSSARPNFLTKIAKINLQANKYALETQKMMLQKDMEQIKQDIAGNNKKLTNYNVQTKQAEDAVKIASSRYKYGVITNLELLTAQTNLQDAQLGKLQLEYNLLLSKLDLNKLGAVKFW